MQIQRISLQQTDVSLDVSVLPEGLIQWAGSSAAPAAPLAQFLRQALAGEPTGSQPGAPCGKVVYQQGARQRTIVRNVAAQPVQWHEGDPGNPPRPVEAGSPPWFAAPPAHWEHAFWVDFDHRPSLATLISQASARGMELCSAPVQRERVAECEQTLQRLTETLAKLPPCEAGENWLTERQYKIRQQLSVLEAGQGGSGETIQQRRQQLLREKECLESELERRLHPATTPSSHDAAELHAQRQRLDQQIAHAQQMLQQLSGQRQALEAEIAGLTSWPDTAPPRTLLRRLEQRLDVLQQQSVRAAQDATAGTYQCRSWVITLPSEVHTLRQDLYQLCNSLSSAEQHSEYAERTHQVQTLSRCESDLQQVLEGWIRQRRELVHPARPERQPELLRSEHAQRCGCASHPNATASADLQTLGEWLDPAHFAHSPLAQLQERLVACQHELEMLDLADREDDSLVAKNLRGELRRLSQSQPYGEQREELVAHIRHTRKELWSLRTSGPVPRILEDAGNMLQRLSDGELTRLCITPTHQLLVLTEGGELIDDEQLSPRQADQVYLSLAMALAAAWRRRGIYPPLLLHEPFRHADLAGVRAAIAVLRDLVREGQQVLVSTDRSQIAAWMEEAGADVCHLHPVAAPAASPEPVPATAVAPVAAEAASTPEVRSPGPSSEFFLTEAHPIEEAPSVDARHAGLLRQHNVFCIRDLLKLDADGAARQLAQADLTPERIRDWQAEARLVCRVPRLRPYDARILVACGITHADQLQQIEAAELRERVEQFACTEAGRVLLGVGTRDELSRILAWIGTPRLRQLTQGSKHADPTVYRFDGRGASVPAPHGVLRRVHAAGQAKDDAAETSQPAARERKVRPGKTGSDRSSLPADAAQPSVAPFSLQPRDPIAAAPFLNRRTAKLLEQSGVRTVADLLQANAQQLADRCEPRRLKPHLLRIWQQQAGLMCRVPQLGERDAYLLVACGIHDPAALASASGKDLQERTQAYLASSEGQRRLPGYTLPEAATLQAWISRAAHARSLRAA